MLLDIPESQTKLGPPDWARWRKKSKREYADRMGVSLAEMEEFCSSEVWDDLCKAAHEFSEREIVVAVRSRTRYARGPNDIAHLYARLESIYNS